MALLFENLIPTDKEAFIAKVKKVASNLVINPDWLMAVMYKESRLSSSIQNSIGATGLIQFMPATAVSLGTTTAALKAMTAVQQLDYVYKYYKPYRLKLNSYPDLQKATVFPISIGKPQDWVFRSSTISAAAFAKANPACDINKDGQVTVAEFEQYCYSGFSADVVNALKKKI